MKKEEVLYLLESESVVEEQGLKATSSRGINVGRLSGIIYRPPVGPLNPLGKKY